jgi:hypothetical protein
MLSKFGDPTMYSNESFKDFALLLRGKTGNLTAMAQAGGDQNILGIMNMVADTILQRSKSGEAPGKSGMEASGALALNMSALRKADSATADFLEQYIYDSFNGKFNGNIQAWMSQAITDKTGENKDTTAALRTQVGQASAESTGDKWLNFLNMLKNTFEVILEQISVNLAQFAADARKTIVGVVGFFDPAVKREESLRNGQINAKALILANANLPTQEKAYNAVLGKYGLDPKKIDQGELLNNLLAGELGKLKKQGLGIGGIAELLMDSDSLLKISAYARTKEHIKYIGEQNAKGAKGDFMSESIYSAATNAQGAYIDALGVVNSPNYNRSMLAKSYARSKLVMPDTVGKNQFDALSKLADGTDISKDTYDKLFPAGGKGLENFKKLADTIKGISGGFMYIGKRQEDAARDSAAVLNIGDINDALQKSVPGDSINAMLQKGYSATIQSVGGANSNQTLTVIFTDAKRNVKKVIDNLQTRGFTGTLEVGPNGDILSSLINMYNPSNSAPVK